MSSESSRPRVRKDSHITVATWNVLAQAYARRKAFPESRHSTLKWKTRSERILGQVRKLGVDIVCFQEMDQWASFYEPQLARMGWSGIYLQRSRGKPDGCAIHWRDADWKCTRHEGFTLDDYAEEDAPSLGLEQHEVARQNVFLVAELEPVGAKGGRRPLVVACLHAFWDPAYTPVKRAQVQHVREEVERFNAAGLPVVIAGDFNSLPGEEVYREMQGAVPGPLPPSCDTQPLASAYSGYQAVHGSQFAPEEQRGGDEWSYAGWPACEGPHAEGGRLCGEPEFTNRTHKFEGTLDYIWHDLEKVETVAVERLPTAAELRVRQGSLPDPEMPSDHLPLVAALRFKESPPEA